MKSVRSTGELARRLGLSRWTVSRALNGHGDIGRETAERIRAEAARLGFAPSLIGRSLRSGRTDWIGITLPDLEDYHLTGKVSLLRELLAGAGWQALMHVGGGAEEERAALEQFAAMRCGGVLSVAARCGAAPFAALGRAGIPCVAIDALEEAGVDEVWTDRRAGMRMVVKHLHEAGCRSLVAVSLDPRAGRYSRQRWAGLAGGAKACGWDSSAVACWKRAGGSDIEEGRAAVRWAMGASQFPDAFVALNDRVAFGAVLELHEHGRAVPADVAVTGYDHSDLATALDLTTVDPCSGELVARAVELLLERIKKRSQAAPRRLGIRPRLAVGVSSAFRQGGQNVLRGSRRTDSAPLRRRV